MPIANPETQKKKPFAMLRNRNKISRGTITDDKTGVQMDRERELSFWNNFGIPYTPS